MRTVFLTSLILASVFAFGQDSSSCNCCSESFRQFDFWVGDWEVRDSNGTLQGYNNISPMEDSCALLEKWTGAKGSSGTSVSFYDSSKKQWHQSWIDSKGGSIIMNGRFKDGSMVMYSNKNKGDSGFIQNKTTWIPLEDGRVQHIWEVTKDTGKTWVVVFEGFYQIRTDK